MKFVGEKELLVVDEVGQVITFLVRNKKLVEYQV